MNGNNGSWPVGLVLLNLLLIGCAPIAPDPRDQADAETLGTLQSQVSELSGELVALKSTLAAMRGEQQAVVTELDLQNRALGRVEGAVTSLPASLKQLCPAPEVRDDTACKDPQLQRVVVSGTKMVVGEMEQVWLDPPGLPFDARIETSAGNNALRADEIVEFERDGKGWVRFVLHAPDSDQRIELERRVIRHSRPAQTNGEAVKRPVVRMRLKLGDIEETFSFVLTQRSEPSYQVVLGRGFLKDIAFVDVGARYVQPRVKPEAVNGTPAKAPAPPAQ